MATKPKGSLGDEEQQIAGITYSGGDGSARDEAIIIEEASSRAEGIRARKRYLSRLLGVKGTDWDLQRQSLLASDNQVVDKLTVEKPSEARSVFYFEISSFFRVEEQVS